MKNDDSFTSKVRKTLAERVAWRCSFPNCSVPTVGPQMGDDSKSLNLGQASHICAKSPKGPRYNPLMSSEERRSIQNGIWMCRTHATFIDADFKEYSAETLRLWKKQAEVQAHKNLMYPNCYAYEDNSTLIAIGLRIIVNGYWEFVSHNEWRFGLGSYLKGSKNELDTYILNFSSLKSEERFVLVESQGDARKIKQIRKIFNQSEEYSIVVEVAEKYQPIDPNFAGRDLALGEDVDLILENGDLKLVTGMDAAIQHLTTAASTAYGEWCLDTTMGSFISEYYRDYKDDLNTLSRLIKLEFIRLSLIPTSEDKSNSDSKPTLNFVKRIEKVTINSAELVDQKLNVILELEWGNNEKWCGSRRIFIST